MTPERAKELKPVYDDFCEKKTIQWKSKGDSNWHDWNPFKESVPIGKDQPSFLSPIFDWRTRPEILLKPREWRICPKCDYAVRVQPGQSAMHCHEHIESLMMVLTREVDP
jgi:hypothetical protein